MNKGLVYVYKERLHELLVNGIILPDGYVVEDMREDFTMLGWVVLVYGPDLPYTPPGAEPPRLPSSVVGNKLVFHSWTEQYGT